MDPYRNPFAPGAGSRPPKIAGRQEFIEFAAASCDRLLRGQGGRSMMLLGLRGTGKTVLLNEIGRQIEEKSSFVISRIECAGNCTLAALLYPQMLKSLRSLSTEESAQTAAKRGLNSLHRFASIFKIHSPDIEISVPPPAGIADTGHIEMDLPHLFTQICEAAKAAGKGWLLLIDEIQFLDKEDLSALIISLHKVNQAKLPVMFAGAGLPLIAKLSSEAKSYSERLFRFCEIEPLNSAEIKDAVVTPLSDEKVSIEAEALAEMADGTKGYPFFLQEWAYHAWNAAEGSIITRNDAKAAYAEMIQALDAGFFRIRLNSLASSEIRFVEAMAALGSGPYKIRLVAEIMKKTSGIGPLRSRIAQKGMIYSPRHGFVDFTVPLFDAFIRRQKKL